MHTKEAFHHKESAERIIGLSAWRDMPCYSEQERIALAWAELVISNEKVADQVYSDTLGALGEQALVDLTFAVNAINSWNRVSKVFKPEVGSYKVNTENNI
jgi:alkylhydroperoxidase family enzyme